MKSFMIEYNNGQFANILAHSCRDAMARFIAMHPTAAVRHIQYMG